MIFGNIDLSPSIRKTLEFYSANNTFPQAILVEGGRAEERLALARLINSALLCESSEKPCGECSHCVKIKAASHPDVKEYGDESGNATFKVDICREILHDVFVVPNDGDRKIYILKETQNMNENAENALLKMFEEPPPYAFFILTCDSRSAMLDTILSRTTVISLNDDGEISVSKKTLEISENIVFSICELNELGLLSATGSLEKDKEEFSKVMICLSSIFMEAILKKSSFDNKKGKESVDCLCEKLPTGRIFELYNVVKKLESSLKMNSNYNLTLTRMCYEFRRAINR